MASSKDYLQFVLEQFSEFYRFLLWHFSSLCRCIIVIYFRFIADCIIRLNLRRDGDIFACVFRRRTHRVV